MKVRFQAIFFLVLICCLFTSNPLRATHLFGGEMTYECLGNDTFKITMTVYQNCKEPNGIDYAFDPASKLFIFDKDTNFIYAQNMPMIDLALDTIEIPIFDTCQIIPSDVCIHFRIRSAIIVLPYIEGGYIATFQRCCLGSEVSNVVEPDLTGVNLTIEITEQGLLSCNNSPVFNDLPPSFFCVYTEFDFEHSALDLDGDSLVYEFAAPFRGANYGISSVNPPYFPPFDPVLLPLGFDENNLFGTAANLTINSQTGQISGVVPYIGLYMLGVVVSDYRYGQLLSRTMRTLVYSIDVCSPLILSDFEYKKNCDGSTVQLVNQSENATNFCWDFNFENTCQEASPTIPFPSEGDYLVTLIAEPNHGCADTSEQILTIEKPCGFESLESGFQIQTKTSQICAGEKSQLSVLLCDNYSYQWNPSPELSSDNIHNPMVSPQITTIYEVEIFDGDSCIWIAQIEVEVLEFCDKPVIALPNAFTPDGDGINDSFGGLSNFQFQSYEFKIYSRWGELVYQANSIDAKWNGKYKNKIAVSDVYIWTLQYSYQNRNEIISEIKKGDVTLIR